MIDETAYPVVVMETLKRLARDEKELEELLNQWDERCGMRHFEGGEDMQEPEFEALKELVARLDRLFRPFLKKRS